MNEPLTPNARRFEIYVRWSAYLLVAIVPLQLAVQVLSGRVEVPMLTGPVLVLALLHLGLAVRWVRRGIESWRTGVKPGRPALIALLSVSVVLMILIRPWLGEQSMWPLSEFLLIGITAMCYSVLLRWPQAVALLAALGVPMLAVALFVPDTWSTRLGFVAIGWGYCIFLVLAGWSMVWMLRVLFELQDAQADRARLAVAEERLRISRDLHDVFGRTLATISVKSQLAEQLARRGRPAEAAEEMAQIRQISETAGTEVRRVVRGDPQVALAHELEGAQALLASAGISTDIVGGRTPVTPEQSEALGWVVREAVTNTLRHSRAGRASIALDVTDHSATLTIANDGATARDPQHHGSGLQAMKQRLVALGGSLAVEEAGGWFTLTASIPADPDQGIAPDSRGGTR